MKRYKTFFAVLLTILSLAFIVFVVFMQQRFNNPEFDNLPQAETVNVEADEDEDESDSKDNTDDDEDTVAGAAGSIVNEDNDEEENEDKDTETEEQQETTTSTRVVNVDSLNVRSGPGIDNEIAGVVVLNQSVQVEDSGDEWVKISTDEFTGYVKEKFLSEE